MAPAQAARILAKQDPPVVRWAMMPLFSLGMDFKEHPSTPTWSLNRFKKPWPNLAVR